jgi:uncharacterized repeat protein (TIGR03803 family)
MLSIGLRTARHLAGTVLVALAATAGWSAVAHAAAPAVSFEVLHTFRNSDGAAPVAGLVVGSDGNLYGVTKFGGDGNADAGSVFQLAPVGGLVTLHEFDRTDGLAAEGGLIQAGDGRLYGTTTAGGAGAGTVFRLNPNPPVAFQSLVPFDVTGGAAPFAGLTQAADGNFYGTTVEGGDFHAGTVYRLTPAGALTTLHHFRGSPQGDGRAPNTDLIEASDGNLYGTTMWGGNADAGTIFRLTPQGALSVLHHFSGGTAGANPVGVIEGADGSLYGTTNQGGASGLGTIFRFTPGGSPALQALHGFGWDDGALPNALIQGRDGGLYGTTLMGGASAVGTAFRLTLGAAPALTTLHHFRATDGVNPHAPLVQLSDGRFYGTTSAGGGSQDAGTVFSLRLTHTLTVTRAGTGSGSVASDVGGIACGTSCSAAIDLGSSVTLTATPDAGSTFAGWSGACSGTGPCAPVMSDDRTATATFEAIPPIQPTLTNPAPGATLPGADVAFTWTAGQAALEYWLEVGTTPGGGNLYNASAGTALGASVTNLPRNGAPVYARLSTRFASGWQNTDYTFTAAAGPAKGALTSPAPGSVLPGAAVTFTWSAGEDALQYWLEVGTTPGGGNLYNASTGTGLTASVTNLPTNGAPIFARLSTRFASGWQNAEYTFTAAPAPAKGALTSPAPGAVLPGSSVTFTWSAGTDAQEYWLEVGSNPGLANFYNASAGTGLTATVTNLPTGGVPIYARLSTRSASGWQNADYAFTAAP